MEMEEVLAEFAPKFLNRIAPRGIGGKGQELDRKEWQLGRRGRQVRPRGGTGKLEGGQLRDKAGKERGMEVDRPVVEDDMDGGSRGVVERKGAEKST